MPSSLLKAGFPDFRLGCKIYCKNFSLQSRFCRLFFVLAMDVDGEIIYGSYINVGSDVEDNFVCFEATGL